MYDYYLYFAEFLLYGGLFNILSDISICYLFIGSVFWAPISLYVCWFMKVNDFEIDDKIYIRSMYYLGAIFLWPFVLRAGVKVALDGLVDREKSDD